MNRGKLVVTKPTDEDVIKDITPFVIDPGLEEQIQKEIDEQVDLVPKIRQLVLPDPPDLDGLLDLIQANEWTLHAIIAILGLPKEGLHRLVTVTRIEEGTFDSEWKIEKVRREMIKNRQLGKRILGILLKGKFVPGLEEKIPDFLLASLDIAKLRMEPEAVTDTLARRGIKGRYDAMKGKPVENHVEEVLGGLGVQFRAGEITVLGLSRDFDFVIPGPDDPHVLIEVGVFATTARELSEKGIMEQSLYQAMRREHPDAVMVRVLDGIGWIARGGKALQNVIDAADYVVTQKTIDKLIPPIVRQHVPDRYFI